MPLAYASSMPELLHQVKVAINNGYLERINSSDEGESPLSDSVIDRIVHNSYKVPIYGLKSMRERYGIKGDEQKKILLNSDNR